MRFICLFTFVFCMIASGQSVIDTTQIFNENQNIPTDSLKTPSTAIFEDNDTIYTLDKLWISELTKHYLYNHIQQDSTLQNSVYPTEITTELLKTRLQHLNQKTFFHIEYNPILEQTIKNYLRRPAIIERMMQLSNYYFPMIEEILINEKIPLELKYLPIVESALNPQARSHAGAAGLWQFMYPTGKLFGLELNNYVDERLNPVHSTKAAAKYLKKLYEIFKDWELVLAAYNSGPGNVTKAMRRSRNRKNYWNLRPYLPKETAGYVPAFMAVMYIFEYAKEHGFNKTLPEKYFFQTDTVHVKRNIPFKNIAEITGMSEDEISFFNPSYYSKIIPYSPKKQYSLRLPIEKLGIFLSHENEIYSLLEQQDGQREKPLSKLIEISPDKLKGKHIHIVKKGEVLGKIATRYKVSVKKIKQWNNIKGNQIKIGQKLVIYK